MTSFRFYLSVAGWRPYLFLPRAKLANVKKLDVRNPPPTVPKAISDCVKVLFQLSCGTECHLTIISIVNVHAGRYAAAYTYLKQKISAGRNFRATFAVLFKSVKAIFSRYVSH